jgi:hypothetical protein
LLDRAPDIAAEWHPTLNGDVTPRDVFAGSDARFWWQCQECGHVWQTTLTKRTYRGQGCPGCAVIRRARTQATPDPGCSLEDLRPELAEEWHPTLNGDVRPADVLPGSSVRVWWCCRECQHEWATPVRSRGRRGGGCPPCGIVRRGVLRATPRLGESFGDLYPEVAAGWHPTLNGDLRPTDLKPGSQRKVWWQCPQGHEWRVAPPIVAAVNGARSALRARARSRGQRRKRAVR